MKTGFFNAFAAQRLVGLAIFCSTALPVLAFFPEPDPLILDVGTSGVVKVKGSDGNAAVSLQSIIVLPVTNVTHNLVGTRNGKGFVNVTLKGLAPGNYSVIFFGKNNGDDASGSITVIVPSPPGTSAQNPFFTIAGDPINTRSGEYFGAESVDLNLGGPMPLVFARYVASRLAEDALVEANLGTNRSHNFASRMISEGTARKRVILPAGKMLRFDKVGTKWVLQLPLDVPYQLVEAGGNFLFGHPQTKQIWTYDSTGKLTKIEDGKGNAHTLNYTGAKLTSVSDGLGRVMNLSQPGTTINSVTGVTGAETRTVTFSYTSGVLTSATDYGGHVTTYANDSGLPTAITRAQGNTLFTQLYDANNKVMSQTERGTDTSTLGYAPTTTTFTDPTLATLVDTYDNQGNLISHADEVGNVVAMTYDSSGRRSTVTDRLGHKITIQYHALSGQPTTLINAEGKRTLFTYKARKLSGIVFHDLVKITHPDLTSRAFTYDAKGNVTQITSEVGKVWKFTYNPQGQVLTSINPLGGVTTHTYDAFGNLKTTVAPDVGTTTFDYDDRHRLTQITQPGGATVLIAYDTKDRLTTLTDERSQIHSYAYDSNNRLTSITDPDNEVTNLGHDELDRMTSITDAQLNPSSVTFDSRRLVSSRTDRNGNTIHIHYDSRQRLTSLEDAGGQMWSFGYDEEGRLTHAQNPIDPPAQQKLNKLGYPIEWSDPLGNTHRVTRDAMQRVTQSFDPLGRLTRYAYDKRGLLVSATEQGTGTAKYERDALGNVTKITDPNGGTWTTSYLKSGRVQKMTDPLGKSLTFSSYDTRGRPALLTFADSSTCTLDYDAASHITHSTFSAGPTLVFTYDDLGRLASADDAGPSNEVIFEYDAVGRLTNCAQNGHDFTATYDAGGRLITISYLGGAFTVTYAYDSRDRLTSVTDSAGTLITLGYDDAGRLISQTRTPGLDGSYHYDAAGRLIRILEGGIIDLDYTLNAASEVTKVDFTAPSIPSVSAGTQLLKFGKAGEITTPGHVYDPLGRLITAPLGRTYEWDGASRLTDASGVTLAYNGLGDLITRTENGDTTRYYHHYALGLAPIVYEDPPTGAERVYVWTPGGRLLYSVDLGTGDPTFYHFDRMGSTLALTDKNEVVTDSYAYGPYGEPLAHDSPGVPSTQPFTYVGAYGVRKEGPLYHMRARYYDPQAARFLSRDPLPPRLRNPKSTNRYAYAAQNPLRYIDPQGANDTSIGLAGGFRFTGSGRAGIDSSGGYGSTGPTPIHARLRFNIDASKTLDSGITLGGRIRLQYDSQAAQGAECGGLSAAYLYAEASGYRVDSGTCTSAFDSLASLYNAELGHTGQGQEQGQRSSIKFVTRTGFSSMGLFASYGAGDLVARLPPCTTGCDSDNTELGFIGGSSSAAPGLGSCGPLDTFPNGLTVGPAIRTEIGPWARPELRAFVTATFWNDAISSYGQPSGGPVSDNLFGMTAGVQMESWW
jgi:RHS repeat-associated protein